MHHPPKFYANPLFWIGLLFLLLAILWTLAPEGATTMTFSLTDVSLGSDGRCTGFPNGIGRWNWTECCQVHDLGGSDIELASCLLERTPIAATPLVFFSVGLMALCRPLYNWLQKKGLVK